MAVVVAAYRDVAPLGKPVNPCTKLTCVVRLNERGRFRSKIICDIRRAQDSPLARPAQKGLHFGKPTVANQLQDGILY